MNQHEVRVTIPEGEDDTRPMMETETQSPQSPSVSRIRNILSWLAFQLHDKPWKDFLYAALFFMTSCWFMTYALNYVHFRMPPPDKFPPLPDIIHDLIPKQKKTWMSEAIFQSATIISIASALRYYQFAFFPYGIRFLITWGVSWYIRVAALLATALPATDDDFCRHQYADYPNDFPHRIGNELANTAIGIVSLGNSNIHCGDLMFSGHTVLLTVNWMFMVTYVRRNPLLVILSTCITMTKAFLIVAERQHYTIDVLVSMYVTITMWYLLPEHLPGWLTFPFAKIKQFVLFLKKWRRGPEGDV